MFQSSKTVKTIFYLNVLMFIATLISPSIFTYLAMYNWNTNMFMSWQLLTHQFLHGGIFHIVFNMLVFLSFGPQVEDLMEVKICGYTIYPVESGELFYIA